jgi:xanthine dehydrogenase YagR molybdenum-binding subunit
LILVALYDGTQGPPATARIVANLFDLPASSVHVIADHAGGGFGGKAVPWPGTVLAPLAAPAVGKPVKFAMTRQQMFSLTSDRAPTVQRIRIGANPDGRITALEHDALQCRCKRRDGSVG